MKFAKKDFSYYWNCIKFPVFILLAWYIAAMIFAMISLDLYMSIFSGWAGTILLLLLYAFSGYMIVADHKGSVKNAAWAGALVGMIGGLAGALLGIIMLYLAPHIIDVAIRQAVTQGAPEDLTRTMISIMSFVQIVISPAINGLIGALFGWIGGLIGKR